jgi:elongation factor P hydroxylase
VGGFVYINGLWEAILHSILRYSLLLELLYKMYLRLKADVDVTYWYHQLGEDPIVQGQLEAVECQQQTPSLLKNDERYIAVAKV